MTVDRRIYGAQAGCGLQQGETAAHSGYMLDENEFLSPYGIRSLSKYHLEHPFVFYLDGQEYKVQYLPAESNTGMFGGNSNWRGPIWMPVNALIIRGLLSDVSVLWRRLQS